MNPTQHTSNNAVLQAPAGDTIEECRPLAITRVTYPGDVHGVWSFWRPTDAERAAIASGALVRLMVVGQTHPPLWLDVDGVEET